MIKTLSYSSPAELRYYVAEGTVRQITKTEYCSAEENSMGKFLCNLENPRVNPSGKSNSVILQVSLLCIFQNSSACVICILPQFLIE